MKLIGAYIFHFCLAALTVPWLTLFSAAIFYSLVGHFFSADTSPQMFYSDHFLFVVVVVGMCLAYTVCDTLTNRGAIWIWVPFTAIFLLRILTWKESVMFHSGVLDHFFTKDCQIGNWSNTDFSSCGDKLFLTQLFVASMAYSIGALIYDVVPRRTSILGKSAPVHGTRLLTTRGRVAVAVGATALIFPNALQRTLHLGHAKSGWLLPLDHLLHGWFLIAANIAFYGYLCWLGFCFIRGTEGRERVFMAGWAASILLPPIKFLRPGWALAINGIDAFGLAVALLSALSLLLHPSDAVDSTDISAA